MSLDEDLARIEAEDNRRMKGQRARALEKLGISAKDRRLILRDDLQRTLALAALEEPTTILVLSGSTGVGKTFAAAVWLAQLVTIEPSRYLGPEKWEVHTRAPGLFVTAGALSRWDRYDAKAMQRLFAVNRLVIDDLGTEFLDEKGFLLSFLDELIDARYAGRLETIVTTNLAAPDFKARYGARIVDRLRESGRFVACGSTSLRGQP